MPTIDFDLGSDIGSEFYDIVIVGAGAAGLYLASLLGPNFKVLVLETGHFDLDSSRQQLNEVEQSGKLLTAAVDGRKRAVGGTTLAWGGQSLPFSPLDLQTREWARTRPWPLAYEELASHYPAANTAMGIDTRDYEAESFRFLGMRPPDFDPLLIRFHVSKWAPEPNFRKLFRKAIDCDFTLLFNCQFLDFESEGSLIRRVFVSSLRGRRAAICCRRLILTAGGLETTRLLLWLQQRHGFLAPSQASLLGSGFMDHPCIDAGYIEPADPYRFQRTFNTQIRGGRRYSLRLSGSATWQRQRRRLNVNAAVMMKMANDCFDPYQEFRDFRNVWCHPGKLRTTIRALSSTAWALARDGFVYKHAAIPRLIIGAEQEPVDSSRLSLGSSSDAFGIPRLALHWQIPLLTWQTIRDFAMTVRDEMHRLGLGRLMLREELQADTAPRYDLLHDVAHHMGGAVMGNDEFASVVSRDLRVHGLQNLWVCSAAVFPTSSHSNPTLTLLALAHRLAEHISQHPVPYRAPISL
jgi:choline dehydrogenase-like flavoprotein